MRGFHFICFVALVAVLGLASAAKRPGPPARCLATGSCKFPAPACTSDTSLFVCNQTSGVWQSNHTTMNVSLTMGGPVLFLGDLTLTNNASLVWNESSTAVLTVSGQANFSTANETWLVKVGNADIDEYAEVEKSGSTNYSASARQVVYAVEVIMPTKWKVVAQQAAACHKLYLVHSEPTWDSTIFRDINGTVHHGYTFSLEFYTKSACWKWIILVGGILGYFALLIVVVIAFRFVPSLKAWTAQPIYDTHISSTRSSSKVRRFDDHSYELEDQYTSKSSGNEARFSNDSDETDSIRLDI